MMGWGWNNGMMGWGYGSALVGGIIQMLFLLVVIILVFLLIKRSNHLFGSENYSRSEEILKERFAKGEITEEEYKKMKDVLKK